jgi:diaminopimelate epimerase
MILKFEKYQGAGNDFIIIDATNQRVNLTTEQVKFLCDRRFGIGADGLMIIEPSKEYDFEMDYYNSDGIKASMCGNGGRCIANFAFNHKIATDKMNFKAVAAPSSIIFSTPCVLPPSAVAMKVIESGMSRFF